MSENENGAGVDTPDAAPTKISHRQAPDHYKAIAATRRASILAKSIAYPPVGTRALWLHVVPRCPYGCSSGHVHRGPREGGRRRAGCDLGSYVVEPWVIREVSE